MIIYACGVSLFISDTALGQTISRIEAGPTLQTYVIDCLNEENCAEALANMELGNVKSIELRNFSGKRLPLNLKNAPFLQSIGFIECPGLKYGKIIKQLATLDSLNEIVLDGNSLGQLPRAVAKLNQIRRLVITNDETLDLEVELGKITGLDSLKELGLSVNSISDLPDNIGDLSKLEVLDLRDNNLADLPEGMANLKNLDSLYLEENILLNPVSALSRMKGLQIKYVSLGTDLSDADLKRLEELFPDTRLEKKEMYKMQDTLSMEEAIERGAVSDPIVKYGKLHLTDDKQRAYSLAYLHYPVIFSSLRFRYTFDSLLFEERYRDTTYSNIWKIQPNINYCRIYLKKYNARIKNEIWLTVSRYFGIHIRKIRPNQKKEIWFTLNNRYEQLNNPELGAFRGMVWVYTGGLSKKEFRKTYMKLNLLNRRYYVDLRLYYDGGGNNYSVELKDKSRFSTVQAFPRLTNRELPLEKSQESYERIFERYTKTLERREKRFHRKLFRNKRKYEYNLAKSRRKAWRSFQNMYMSDEEKSMSQADWLLYYDKIIANERRALYNADASSKHILRSLELEGYNGSGVIGLQRFEGSLTLQSSFWDADSNYIAVKSIDIVNHKEKFFTSYKGSLGVNPTSIYLRDHLNVSIIIEARNGDIGYILAKDMKALELDGKTQFTFPVTVIPKKMATVGTLLNQLIP